MRSIFITVSFILSTIVISASPHMDDHGVVDGLGLTYNVTVDTSDGAVVISFLLRNTSASTLYIKGGDLPWRHAGTLNVTLFSPDKPRLSWETEYLPAANEWLPDVQLEPGTEIRGRYALSYYYD